MVLDGSLDLEGTIAEVEELFAAALAEGPCAETGAERRVLLREANAAIVAQVRGCCARPWAQGEAGAVVGEVLCECGSTACQAGVQVPCRGRPGGSGPCAWAPRTDRLARDHPLGLATTEPRTWCAQVGCSARGATSAQAQDSESGGRSTRGHESHQSADAVPWRH